MMKFVRHRYALIFLVALPVAVSGCVPLAPGQNAPNVPDPTADIPTTVPEFDASKFSNPSQIDNPFFPQVVGSTLTYRAETEDGIEEIIIDVPDETRRVLGLSCRVVRDRVFVDGVLIEDTHDWYAQDDEGNIWYMGEEVDNYEYDDDGNLLDINNDGAWEAGKDVAGLGVIGLPGYQMLANPKAGDLYHQEYYKGEAEDMGEVVALDVEVTLSNGTNYTCLQIRDLNPLEPGSVGLKYYAPGIGVVLEEEDDERVELISTGEVPATVPNFDASSFSNPSVIDNPFFPQVIGSKLTYINETEDGTEEIIIEVPDETREVLGLDCRVVRDRVFLDGVLIEDTHDWYAQDDEGNIWYMGEEVDNYEYDDDGNLLEINHDGAWEAGKDVAGVGAIGLPGYQMLADPLPGDLYHQEYYPGEAEDMGKVIALNVEVTLSDGTTYTCLQVQDINPLESDVVEFKFYAPELGVVLEEKVSDDGERVELISVE